MRKGCRNNKRCIDCGKLICDKAEFRCNSCARKGSLNINWQGGWREDKYCLDCGKKLNHTAKYNNTLRCRNCAKNGPIYDFFEKTHRNILPTEKIKKIIHKLIEKGYVKHHIYLDGEELLLLKRKYHMNLHLYTYHYILQKYGKKEINKYLKWFQKKCKVKFKYYFIDKRQHKGV